MPETIRSEFAGKTLRRRFLWLVAILIATESVFVGIFWFQLKETEKEIEMEAHAIEIYKKSQALIYQLDDYERAIQEWVKHDNPDEDKKAEDAKNLMIQETNWLQANVQGKMKDEVEKVAEGQSAMFKLVDKAKQVLGKMHSKMQLAGLAQRYEERADRIRLRWEHSLVNLLTDEEKLLDTFPEQRKQRRFVLSVIAMIGVVCNIILLLSFAYFFLRKIASKLSLMVDNTKRISEKQPMHPRIIGNDELAHLDNALHNMSESMEEAQKERQAFLAMVSHELRTPLMAVSSTFEMLSEGIFGDLQDIAREKSQQSEKLLEKLLGRINDLLDLEKLEAGKLPLTRKTIYLEAAIEKAIDQVQDLSNERHVTIDAIETDIELMADPDRLAQILRNLLQNAIQHSPGGKSVDIEIKEADGWVLLNILDSGPGIAEDLQAQLFERFRSTTDSDQLVIKGMGLPIARHLAAAHNAEIGYTPRPEGGSIFWLRMPMNL